MAVWPDRMRTMTVPSELVVAIQTDDLPCEDDEWIRVSRDAHISPADTPVHMSQRTPGRCTPGARRPRQGEARRGDPPLGIVVGGMRPVSLARESPTVHARANSPLTKTAAHPRCPVYNGAQIRRAAWKRPGAGKLSGSSASEFHRAVRAAKRMATGQMVQHGRAACEQS